MGKRRIDNREGLGRSVNELSGLTGRAYPFSLDSDTEETTYLLGPAREVISTYLLLRQDPVGRGALAPADLQRSMALCS